MSYQQGYDIGRSPRGAMPSRAQTSPGTILAAVGTAIAAIGLVVGVALYMNAQKTRSSSITSLAKDSAALSGCVTELNISRAGTFTLYYVHSGVVRVNGTNNGCSTSDVVPIKSEPILPAMTVSVTSVDGSVLKFANPTTKSPLSASGVSAIPFRQVVVPAPGLYRIEVSGAESGVRFAVAVASPIGKANLLTAFLVGLFGVVGGVGVVLVGLSQRQLEAAYTYGAEQYGQYTAYPPAPTSGRGPAGSGRPATRSGTAPVEPTRVFDFQEQATPPAGRRRETGRAVSGSRSALDPTVGAPTAPMRKTPPAGAPGSTSGLPPIVSSADPAEPIPPVSGDRRDDAWRRDPSVPPRRPVSSPRPQPRPRPDDE